MNALVALFRRDIRIALRAGGGASIAVLFFLIVVTLTPFAVGPDLALLKRIGPAMLWIGALLARLLALDRHGRIHLRTLDHGPGVDLDSARDADDPVASLADKAGLRIDGPRNGELM